MSNADESNTTNHVLEILKANGVDPNTTVSKVVVGIGTEEVVQVSALSILGGAIGKALDEIKGAKK